MISDSYFEEDYKRMKIFLPEYASHISPIVERVCDKMEYEGSRMYDEVPDKNMIRKLCEEVYRALEYKPLAPETEWEEDDVFAMNYRRNNDLQAERLLRELIMVMLYAEMYSRRCCRNQCRRIKERY